MPRHIKYKKQAYLVEDTQIKLQKRINEIRKQFIEDGLQVEVDTHNRMVTVAGCRALMKGAYTVIVMGYEVINEW